MKEEQMEIWDAHKVDEIERRGAGLALRKIAYDLDKSERLEVPLSSRTLLKMVNNLCKYYKDKHYCTTGQESHTLTWLDIAKKAAESKEQDASKS